MRAVPTDGGAGRKAGEPNKVTLKHEREIARSGLTPLDYMLKVLRDPQSPKADRMWAAVNAAPYCHPRLVSVEVSLKGNAVLQAVTGIERSTGDRAADKDRHPAAAYQ